VLVGGRCDGGEGRLGGGGLFIVLVWGSTKRGEQTQAGEDDRGGCRACAGRKQLRYRFA